MSLRIQTNIEAFNAHRNLVSTDDADVEVDGDACRPASGSTAPPTTPPASRSARSCTARSAASTRPSATPRTPSRSCRRLKARSTEVHSMLQRVRDLAVQYNNGTLVDRDKDAITAEVAQLCAEIDRIGHADAVQRHPAAHRRRRRSPSRSAPTTARRSRSRGLQLVRLGLELRGRLGDLQLVVGAPSTLASIDAAIDNVSTARATSARCRTASSTR